VPRSRSLAGVSLLTIAVVLAGLAAWFGYQSAVTPATMTVPSVSSSPSSEPLPSVTVPPTPTPTMPAKVVTNPRGKPESLTIKRGDKTIVKTMPFAPRAIDSSHPGWFSSKCGAVAYWNEPGWPKPGVESPKKALITGHVMCGSNWYPLQHLQPDVNNKPGGRKDDLLYIQYDSGDLVIAQAKEDSHDVIKTSLNKQKQYTENGGKRAREIRLTSCDRNGIIRQDGHALNNVVQRFVVIDVIRVN